MSGKGCTVRMLVSTMKQMLESTIIYIHATKYNQNSQGSREHENCNKGAGSTVNELLSVKRQQRTNRELNRPIVTNRCRYAAKWFIFLSPFRDHAQKNQGVLGKNKKEQGEKQNEKGAEKKCKGAGSKE